MNRLTDEKTFTLKKCTPTCVKNCMSCAVMMEVIGKLAGFEDFGLAPETMKEVVSEKLKLETLGGFGLLLKWVQAKREDRLVVLPCSVGDHVWINGVLGVGEAEEHLVTSVSYREDQDGERMYCHADLIGTDGESWVSFFDDQIGETVFLTREEAEKALRSQTVPVNDLYDEDGQDVREGGGSDD